MRVKYLVPFFLTLGALLVSGQVVAQTTSSNFQPFEVQVLVINGQNFPFKQFRTGGPDACPSSHYHGGTVLSLDNQSLSDPNPGGCGFGRVDQTELKTIRLSIDEVEQYTKSALATPQEIAQAKQALAALIAEESVAVPEEVVALDQETPAEGQATSNFFEEQERALQTTLIILVPLVIISSASLLGYIPHLPSLLYHLMSWFLALFGKKKKRKYYGAVYDSITKRPLSLGIVRVFSLQTQKLVSTIVTDQQGRYDVLLPPGDYRIEALKPEYLFPSQIVHSASDGVYQNVYQSEQGLQVKEAEFIVPDIPLDQIDLDKTWQAASAVKKLWFAMQKAGRVLALPILLAGFILSIFILAAVPSVLNWLISLIYLLLLLLQFVLRPKSERPWGVVYESSTQSPLALVSLQLIDSSFGKVVESRLSDYKGRFSFFPEPGKYQLKASKEGFLQLESTEEKGSLPKDIIVSKSRQRLLGDVFLQKN